MVEQLFLAVQRGCLWFVIMVFPDHTHLLFWKKKLVEQFQDGCLVLGNLFLSAMPRGVAVANIYVVNQLFNQTLMVDNFL